MNQPRPNLSGLTRLNSQEFPPEVITITSGKGGVGKSSVGVNLAILMRQFKRRVLLIDADIHLGNVDLMLGLRTKYTIADVIIGDMDLQDVIVEGPGGVHVLPAASAVMKMLEMEDGALKRLSDAFARFEMNYDTVLVDTGAGISRNVLSFVLGADKVVLIATPDPASMADAYGMIKVIRKSYENMPILMIANMVSSTEEGESLHKKMNLMVTRFLDSQLFFGGSILRSDVIDHSVKLQKPLVLSQPHSADANSLKAILGKLMRLPIQENGQRRKFLERFIDHRDTVIGEEL